jgi:hypothetical protein
MSTGPSPVAASQRSKSGGGEPPRVDGLPRRADLPDGPGVREHGVGRRGQGEADHPLGRHRERVGLDARRVLERLPARRGADAIAHSGLTRPRHVPHPGREARPEGGDLVRRLPREPTAHPDEMERRALLDPRGHRGSVGRDPPRACARSRPAAAHPGRRAGALDSGGGTAPRQRTRPHPRRRGRTQRAPRRHPYGAVPGSQAVPTSDDEAITRRRRARRRRSRSSASRTPR